MICPRCKNNLVLSDSQGVEIDYCPKCKGVWLYRGQLEKIIENAKTNRTSDFREDNDDEMDGQNHDHHNNYRPYSNNPKRKRGFLYDLFDF